MDEETEARRGSDLPQASRAVCCLNPEYVQSAQNPRRAQGSPEEGAGGAHPTGRNVGEGEGAAHRGEAGL